MAVWLIKILAATHRTIFFNKELIDSFHKDKKQIIFIFWHGKQFSLVNSHKNQDVCIMTSLSLDGGLQANILSRLGYFIVRGSSSRGGGKALVGMIKAMKNAKNVAFAADGPRGPIYELKPGPIYLAKKTKAAIIPVAVAAESYWELENWDKYLIPKPFSKTYIEYGQPIFLDEEDGIENCRLSVNKSLNDLQKSLEVKIKRG